MKNDITINIIPCGKAIDSKNGIDINWQIITELDFPNLFDIKGIKLPPNIHPN
ncbi:hypothetical protein SDC9_172600 [bioreactor metagenome]|uniref:Uncharacterized protein n=1 Tax=bioreactor metagenome TaxID=1076179 RepID=A0A645GNB4_9ZZZZ